MDIKLDASGDIDVTTGDLQLLGGQEATSQELRIRLRTFLGEWFADTRIGIPYFESILVKNPDSAAVQNFFREAILQTPGVVQLQGLTTAYDGPSRTLSVTFVALVDGNFLLTETVELILP